MVERGGNMVDAIFAVIENEEQRNELAEFYEKYKSRLYRIALKKPHNEADAEDAVQEVFLSIAGKPERFFDLALNNRLAYVDVMVRNISMKMYNAKCKVPIEPLDDDIEAETVSLEDVILDNASRDEIMRCLVGLSVDETAERLNILISAANKDLSLARKALREFINERNDKK